MEDQINRVFARLDDIAQSLQSLAGKGHEADGAGANRFSGSRAVGSRSAANEDSRSDDLAAVTNLILTRRMRTNYFEADLFFDPTWSMLIDMYQSKLNGERLSITDVCLGSGVASTTALRYIALLEQRGYVNREPDPSDKRRVFLQLTPAAIKRLRGYFGSVGASCRNPQAL